MKLMLCLALTLILVSPTAAIDVKPKPGGAMSESNSSADMLAAADSTFRSHQYESALDRYAAAARQARLEQDPSVETEALAQVARCELLQGHKDAGKQALEEARLVASDTHPLGWSRYLGVRGRFEWQSGELAMARKTFEDMHEYCHANALRDREIDAAHMIAIVATSPEDQIEWGRKGIEAAEAYDVPSWLGPLWNNLAGTYYDQKNYDSALACYLKAREYHWRFSGEIGKLFADYHVGMTYRLTGQYQQAAQWLRPVLAWAERLDHPSAIGQACEDLGEVAVAKGNKAEGLKLLRRARDQYRKAGFDTSWPQIWENINNRLKELGG